MTAQPQAGDQAPDFSLPIGAAAPLRLGALKGSKVVLYFYPTDDTEACTAEAIAFNGLRAAVRAGADARSSAYLPIPSPAMTSSNASTGLR